MQDIRWLQRFENYKKALSQLKKFIDKGTLSELEEQGLIKAFEYTYELAWNTIKDYMFYQGNNNITGSRDAIREAFQVNLIEKGDDWMDMLASRNRTSHIYNEETAKEISHAIQTKYFQNFLKLKEKLEELKTNL